MPTFCEPWPGKTWAVEVIAASVAVESVLTRAGVCDIARKTARVDILVADEREFDPRRMTVETKTGARRLGPPPPARAIARRFEADLSATVLAAGTRISNVRQISERVAMGRALWRELVIGFASQLGEMRLGFTQLAALYVLADSGTMTIGELAEVINRSPSATSRLVDGLVRRRLVERRVEEEDRRQRTLQLTPRGAALLRVVDRARADQFLSAVRPMPRAERALIAMGVAALATHAISRRGRLIKARPE